MQKRIACRFFHFIWHLTILGFPVVLSLSLYFLIRVCWILR